MKKKSRIIASVLALTLAVNGAMYSNGVFDKGSNSPSYLTACAVDSTDIYSVVTDGNNSSNTVSANSTTWASPDKTYLSSNADGTLSRITVNSSNFTVDTYNSDYSYASGVDIDFELPVWGGYYCGSQYNFCLFGQQNYDEDDSVEVMRVVKYSKDWERIDSFSVFGSNTRTPFFAGSPDMYEENGRLYVHASHEMYASDDGYNHQSNYQLHLDIETMESIFLFDDISYIERGYVSHSFDQYVKAEGDYVYTVDHGDAYPRSVVICKKHYNGSMIDHTEPFPIYGDVGNNTTGVSLGGFELTENKCIVAGNSIPQDGTASSTAQRNIFVTITDKEFSTSEIIYLTEFEDTFRVSKPKLVKLDDTTFVVMWNEYNDDGEVMRAVKMDENGNILEEITTGTLVSACDPIVIGEEIVWPVSDGSCTVFYHLNHTELTVYDGIEGAGELEPEPDTGIVMPPQETWFMYYDYETYAAITFCSTGQSYVEVPADIFGLPVTEISTQAFKDCTSIKTVIIPDVVQLIGEEAFYGCTALKSVDLPESVNTISSGAFIGCTSLETVTIENPLCEIYDSDNVFPEGTVIKGYSGSTAEAYAEKYGFEFVSIGGEVTNTTTTTTTTTTSTTTTTTTTTPEITDVDIVYGDADSDGLVKMSDVIRIMCYASNAEKFPMNAEQIFVSDVYQRGDGVDVSDALSVQKKVAQVIEALPES